MKEHTFCMPKILDAIPGTSRLGLAGQDPWQKLWRVSGIQAILNWSDSVQGSFINSQKHLFSLKVHQGGFWIQHSHHNGWPSNTRYETRHVKCGIRPWLKILLYRNTLSQLHKEKEPQLDESSKEPPLFLSHLMIIHLGHNPKLS